MTDRENTMAGIAAGIVTACFVLGLLIMLACPADAEERTHGLARLIAVQCGPLDRDGIDEEVARELQYLTQLDVANNWPTAEAYGFDIYRHRCTKEQAVRALLRNCETDTECESQPAVVFAADTNVLFVMYPYIPAFPDPAPPGVARDDVDRATWALVWDGAIAFVDLQKPKVTP